MTPGPLKEPKWSDAEKGFLLLHLADLGYAGVGKALARFGFPRTETAVRVRATRLGVSTSSANGDYCLNRLAHLLGVCPKHVKRHWGARGLPIRQIAVARGICYVTPHDLRAFLVAHPEACDWTRLDDLTRVDLDLADMPERPKCKIIECACGRQNTVLLDETPGDRNGGGRGHCRFCGRRMTKWAVGYSPGPPTPRKPPKSKLKDMHYYVPELDRLRCLDCGKLLRAINSAHVWFHGHDSVAAYWRAHALPADAPLLNEEGRRNLGRNWGKTKGAYKLHKRRWRNRRWRPADHERLRREYATCPDPTALAIEFRVSVPALRCQAQKLGLRRAKRAKRARQEVSTT